MLALILRRLALMIPILLGVTFVTFIIINATGSPFASLTFNPRVSQADIDRLESIYGLDKPVGQRYFIWVSNVLRGEFGISLISGKSVTDMILTALPNTVILSGLSITLAFLLALPTGIYCAVKSNSFLDRVFTTAAVAGFAIPTVWLGLMLILLFSGTGKLNDWGLPPLPVGGVRDLRDPDSGFFDRIEHLILPVAALTIPQLAGWVVYIRSNMLEVIRQEYVRTAQAKGLHQSRVLFVHAFRNALLPLVTLIGLSIPDVFGGALVIENVFAYPGMGRLSITAVGEKDYTVVLGVTLFFAVLVILGNLIADVMYGVLDPRLRHK
jgi:peptide/nickel transport system permease protein